MKTVTEKEKPRAASRVSTKPASRTKKPAEKSGKAHVGECSRTSHIEKLKANLQLILHPDFSKGDYYLRMDQGLIGQLPGIASDVLSILNEKHPGNKR